MATPSVNPINVASFRADTYNFDPLVAGETVSQSAKIAASLGVLKRGTVLFGPLSGVPITTSTNLTTVATGAVQRVILAQDIDTGTGAAVTAIVYTQGKFLDTAMTFSVSGAASDAANLWDFGIYVLTVEQRSGLLVPMISLPATSGPLPQALATKDAAEVLKEQVAAIKAGIDALRPAAPEPPPARHEPPWAIAAYGERKLTAEEQAHQKAAEDAAELAAKQAKALRDLEAKQAKELADLYQQQQQERAQFVKKSEEALSQAQSPPPAKK